MNKKALYSILSTIVAMIVLSVSLVFAIGPRISADEAELTIGVLDKAEYFNIDNGVLNGLSGKGFEYAASFDRYHIVIPFGVVKIAGYGLSDCGNAISVTVSRTVSEIGYCAFRGLWSLLWAKIPNNVVCTGDLLFQDTDEPMVFLESEIEPDGWELDGGYSNYATEWLGCDFGSDKFVYTLNDDNSSYQLMGYVGYDRKVIIPQSYKNKPVTVINERFGNTLAYVSKVYCECSKEYANEHWSSNWEDGCSAQVVWNCNKTVSFNTQDGSAVENQIVCVDSLVTTPAVPTKDGYAFKGWYTDAECTDAYDFETAVTDDMTLYAKWEEVQTQPEPETPSDENAEVNNQNNAGLIWGIAGTAAGILIISGIVFGIVIAKRRRK